MDDSYDSELERQKESEQLKIEILEHLRKKDEPLTLQQISYQLKAAKKSTERAIAQLQVTEQIIKKNLAKNSIVYFLPIQDDLKIATQVPQIIQSLIDGSKFLQNHDKQDEDADSPQMIVTTT